MPRRVTTSSLLLLALAALLALSACDKTRRIRLATTTSTDNSGLLGDLMGAFQQESGIQVDVIAVGTGQALALGRRGDADVLLVHARQREDAFVAAGHGAFRRDVMFNDFVLLGPATDPAGIRGQTDVTAAFASIRTARAAFVSRGDDSGTHIRELALWAAVDGPPKGESFYLEAGQGMGGCLLLADNKRAYVLADRGTWLAFKARLELEILVQGDAGLRNHYGIIPVAAENTPAGVDVRRLVDWLTSAAGQRRIGAFKVDGQILFHPATPP